MKNYVDSQIVSEGKTKINKKKSKRTKYKTKLRA